MNNQLSISETDQGRSFWLEQGLAQQHREQVVAADVLIVPLKNFREGVKFVFHQDTASFARYLNQQLGNQAVLEVLADDDEYLEIALHGASFRFSTIIVSSVLAPLVINLISCYLYDVLKAKSNDSVEMTIVIEDQKCSSMRLEYTGDAREFSLVADKVGQISRDCIAASKSHGSRHVANSSAKVHAGSEVADHVSPPALSQGKLNEGGGTTSTGQSLTSLLQSEANITAGDGGD